LQRVAVVGTDFDTDEFVALSGVDEQEAFEHLDEALEAGVIEPTTHAYHFRHALVREALLDELPPHRRRQIHREAARRLIELDASPARIGHHLMRAERAPEAVPYLLRAAAIEAAAGAYRDALTLVDAVRPHAVGADRAVALSLRGDLLNALGDPLAASAYREALQGADPAAAPRLRARLARTAVMSGDLETAAAALEGLEPDGGEDDADILLARGNYAYFVNDFETAAEAARQAERLVLAGTHNWKVLDLVSLQGLLAHRAGEWFDRIRLELKRTRETPDVANAIFDGHLCASEYVLYGPTPYAEVIEVGLDIKRTARRSGALRAEGFAAVLVGEAALLSGNLALAEAELGDARELHRDLGSRAGEAVSLQRLAKVEIARDEYDRATVLLQQALPLARGSLVANHVLQRIFGALVTAEQNPEAARVIVDRAEATLGWDEVCPFCDIMIAIPATMACARCGDVEHARRHLAAATRSAMLWAGTSWEAAHAEAQAAVALATGDHEGAAVLLDQAAAGFERAGQPLDARRCRQRLATA
jgi:predicted negative regulator of RcsB-dependent stress response